MAKLFRVDVLGRTRGKRATLGTWDGAEMPPGLRRLQSLAQRRPPRILWLLSSPGPDISGLKSICNVQVQVVVIFVRPNCGPNIGFTQSLSFPILDFITR